MITLLAKKANATKITNYHPIALCNVLHKINSKPLTSRVQIMLPSIISLSQSEFAKGYPILYNMSLAYNLVRHYKRKHVSSRVKLKFDICKAYDNVSWKFLEASLFGFSFPDIFIFLIMKCVNTSSFSINVNGYYRGYFTIGCGLRRRLPSPLFLFFV